MKKFLKISIFCLIATVVCSCAGLNMTNYTNVDANNTNVVLSCNNYKIVGQVTGEFKAVYILGIGGFSKKALTENARANMYQNANIKNGQAIINVSTTRSVKTIVGPIYVIHTAVCTGTIIEFIDGKNQTQANSSHKAHEQEEIAFVQVEDVTTEINTTEKKTTEKKVKQEKKATEKKAKQEKKTTEKKVTEKKAKQEPITLAPVVSEPDFAKKQPKKAAILQTLLLQNKNVTINVACNDEEIESIYQKIFIETYNNASKQSKLTAEKQQKQIELTITVQDARKMYGYLSFENKGLNLGEGTIKQLALELAKLVDVK